MLDDLVGDALLVQVPGQHIGSSPPRAARLADQRAAYRKNKAPSTDIRETASHHRADAPPPRHHSPRRWPPPACSSPPPSRPGCGRSTALQPDRRLLHLRRPLRRPDQAGGPHLLLPRQVQAVREAPTAVAPVSLLPAHPEAARHLRQPDRLRPAFLPSGERSLHGQWHQSGFRIGPPSTSASAERLDPPPGRRPRTRAGGLLPRYDPPPGGRAWRRRLGPQPARRHGRGGPRGRARRRSRRCSPSAARARPVPWWSGSRSPTKSPRALPGSRCR